MENLFTNILRATDSIVQLEVHRSRWSIANTISRIRHIRVSGVTAVVECLKRPFPEKDLAGKSILNASIRFRVYLEQRALVQVGVE